MSETIEIILKLVLITSTIILTIKIGKICYFYLFTIKNWVKVDGIITNSEIKYQRSKIDTDTEGWKEAIEYSFIVNQTNYKGSCLTKNLQMLHSLKYQAKQNNFKIGQNIIVSYNPLNPNQSVIEDKFDLMNIILPFGILMIGFIIVF